MSVLKRGSKSAAKALMETMAKRGAAPAALLACFFFLLGMGELGGGSAPVDKIPTPEKLFSAAVVDREGVQTTLQSFSFEGKIFLSGKHGSASITIPFEKIAEIRGEGVPMLLVEQEVGAVFKMSNRNYVLSSGKIIAQGTGEELLQDEVLKRTYLGL